MSLATNRRNGAHTEDVVASYLAAHGFPLAERRRLEGVLDRGDMAGVKDTVIEVKHAQQPDVQAWWREAERELVNAGAKYTCVWWRPPRRVDPAKHVVIVDACQFSELVGGQGGAEYVLHPWSREPVSVLGDRADADLTYYGVHEFETTFCAWWPIGVRRINETAFYVTSGRQYVALLRRIVGETI